MVERRLTFRGVLGRRNHSGDIRRRRTLLVICCGMPRSGSTLQYQIVCELIERAGTGVRPKGWPSPIEPRMVAAASPVYVAKMHDPDPRLQDLDPRFTRYVYVYRDVRDAIASHLQKMRAAGEGDIPPARIGDVVRQRMLEPFMHFTTRPAPMLVSRYEEMIADVPGEVACIAGFLGIRLEESEYASIAAALELSAQREYLESHRWSADEAWDERTLLHRNHINDGRVGKHRDVLSAAQLRAVERVAGAWLIERGYMNPPVRVEAP